MVIRMLEELKKIFGDEVIQKKISDKPNIALFLARRDMYRVEIDGVSFVLIHIDSEEKFGISALKKQQAIYVESMQSNIAFEFEEISKTQRDALIKHRIPFVAFPGQVYLPFLGVMLSDQFRKINKVSAEKMMPVTQMLFIYLLRQNTDYTLKSVAADALGLTRTSMTRASEQLLAMGLIDQEKVGKEFRMRIKYGQQGMWEKARPYLINPVQKRIVVRERDVKGNYLAAGESALSEYSMLNAPKVKTVALYKGSIKTEELEDIDARWEETENLLQLELWKYDPFIFADGDKVDRISLACSLADCEDERVEMAVEEMLEGNEW